MEHAFHPLKNIKIMMRRGVIHISEEQDEKKPPTEKSHDDPGYIPGLTLPEVNIPHPGGKDIFFCSMAFHHLPST